MIIFCLNISQLAADCFIWGAGGDNSTLNYFYALVFEAYKIIIFGISFDDFTFVPRTLLLLYFFLLINIFSFCCL